MKLLSATGAGEDRKAQRPRRRLRPYKRLPLRKIIEYSVLLALVSLIAVAAVGVISGNWQIRPILSGSMRPGFPIGGVVVTKRMPLSDLQIGDVAVLHPPSDPHVQYAHRVIYLRHEGLTDVIRTKGDDNLYRDPWTLRVNSRYVYIAQFTLPLLGYPAVWAHSPSGRFELLIVAALLAILFLLSLMPGRRRARVKRERASAGSAEQVPAADSLDAAP